jgi:hypothetical protein
MRYKLTLFLLGCNIIVFCLVHYMDKRADSARRLEEQSTLVLRPGSIEQADSLELSGHGVPTPWRLQRQDGRWLMVEPQTWPVNPFAVENILDQLRFMRMETSFAVSEIESSGMTLADYGLDNPSVVLKIGSASGQALLRIGAPTRVGGRLYVLSDDGTRAFVTSRDILSALLVDLDKLRNLQVFDIPPYSVGSISVQRADGARLRLNKTDGRWHFESPIRVGADSDAVDAFIASLTGIRIRTFAQQDPAAQGLLSPRLRIGIESPEKRLSLLIGAPTGDGGVFAKLDNSPEVFTVDESLVDMLSRMQEQLRERRFSRFGQTPPDRVTVSLDGQGATLQRLETGDWQVLISGEGEGVTTWKADKAVITTMLEALDMMQALRFVSDAPSEADLEGFGFNQPQRKVQLQFGGHSRTLVFGDLEPRTRGVYVKIADEPFVYEVGAAVLDKLSPLPLFYRSRELETLPPAARITHLRLVRLSDGAAVLDEGPALGEGWEGILNSPDDSATPPSPPCWTSPAPDAPENSYRGASARTPCT